MSALTSRCLVLNKSWTPLKTISVKQAITLVTSTYANGEPKAKIIDPESYAQMTWMDWAALRPEDGENVIRTTNDVIKVPTVILYSRYNKVPVPKNTFSRRALFKRDGYMCQYCGIKPGGGEVSIDHVVPKSQGGLTTWENCVLSCVTCNFKKAGRTPQQAHMKLLKVPKKPPMDIFRFDTAKPIDSWKNFISEAYWEVPLQD